MARQSNMRWLGFTGGEKLPKKGKRRKKLLKQQAKNIAKLNGLVKTRKMTEEELKHFR